MSATNWSATKARARSAGIAIGRARLSGQIERLIRATDPCFAAGYIELVSSLELQLRAEEAALESLNSRALRSHQDKHAHVLAALHQSEPQVEEGNVALGREALALLDQWLPLQRASMDMAMLIARTPMGRRPPLEQRRSDPGRRRLRQSSQSDRDFAMF
ncbi:MAG TPA: hypothetical protein VF861_09240 [Telluria sp.]